MTRPRRTAASAGIARRRAFQKPSKKYQDLIAELTKTLTSFNADDIITTSPESNNLLPNGDVLTRDIFFQITSQGNTGIHRHVTQVYVQFICDFVNRVHERNTQESIPVCATLDADIFSKFYRKSLQGRNNDDFFDYLQEAGLGPREFMQVRHLFILDRSYMGHISLIVVSPLARTVDCLDSHVMIDDMRKREEQKLGIVFRLLAQHLGETFLTYEWRIRQGHSPYQGVTSDCAAYAMTNAMFVALGYPLDYSSQDMMVRRQRIAADLLHSNGKDGMFFHDRPGVPIPEEWKEFAYRLTEHWAGPDANDRSRGFRPMSQGMMDFLPLNVRARRGRYAHIQTEEEMEGIVKSTRAHKGLENRTWGSLEEFVERVELRDENLRRKISE